MPDRFVTIPEIPLTANGKLDERALRGLTPALSSRRSVRSLPRDIVELRLQRIWREVLGIAAVQPSDDFFDLGGHSLLAVRLGGAIFDEFGVELPLARLFTHRTLEQLAELLRDERPASSDLLVPLQPGGGDPLVCFPGAGGSLLYFHDLLNALGPELAVWGAQAPGLADPIGAPADVAGLAALYADAVVAHLGAHSRPSLIGHSFGALVAFETARLLQLRGVAVRLVGIVDNPAPGLDGSALDDDGRDWLVHIATRIERLYGVDLNLDTPASGEGERDPAWLLDRLTAAAVLPGGTGMYYFGGWIELYRATARAAAAYRAPAPVSFPLTVFKARDMDTRLERTQIADDALGWSSMTSAAVTVVDVPGTHITMLTGSNVRVIAGYVRAAAGVEPNRDRQDVTS
jgi:thioesterase domain-containing protein/acyl carrier protein